MQRWWNSRRRLCMGCEWREEAAVIIWNWAQRLVPSFCWHQAAVGSPWLSWCQHKFSFKESPWIWATQISACKSLLRMVSEQTLPCRAQRNISCWPKTFATVSVNSWTVLGNQAACTENWWETLYAHLNSPTWDQSNFKNSCIETKYIFSPVCRCEINKWLNLNFVECGCKCAVPHTSPFLQITLSNWEDSFLTARQVRYAALDSLVAADVFRGLRFYHAEPQECSKCNLKLGMWPGNLDLSCAAPECKRKKRFASITALLSHASSTGHPSYVTKWVPTFASNLGSLHSWVKTRSE